jgi:hypothetical protein
MRAHLQHGVASNTAFPRQFVSAYGHLRHDNAWMTADWIGKDIAMSITTTEVDDRSWPASA